MTCRPFTLLLIALTLAAPAAAETGYNAWLRYDSIDGKAARQAYDGLPATVVALDDSIVVKTAQEELIRGVRGMLGRTLRAGHQLPDEDAILTGTFASIRHVLPDFDAPTGLKQDGYLLQIVKSGGHSYLVVSSPDERGVLYGAFALLRKIALREPITALNERESPYAPVRMLDHWDNLDGTIERGYAGRSIFFENGNVVADLGRVRDYARLMASVGINACSINNVNANPRVITTEFLPQLARVAEAFRPWGVRLFVSIDFGSPRKIGGLDTFDPLDPRVADWWKRKVDEIYSAIPDFGGFVLKADSEGRVGPASYGRTHAAAANLIARPLKRHGGLIFYRGFVYDHHMDWRNLKNDRASAAYDNFAKLDGQFEDNVVLQIKYGPIDFQVREPASPLFGALEKTDEAIELQITQEYTGQQRHLCFLVPMWKEVLDFDMHANGSGTPVKQLVAGKTFNRPVGGFVGVANVGLDTNWLGHHLAMANLYGFGRLAWNPDLSSKQVAEEWTRLTFNDDPEVVRAVVDLQLRSWPAYEKYTGPLGAGTLTDIIGVHYGPAIESSERNGWGQWHRADEKGIGMDRTVATGTGFIGQYRPPVAAKYESLRTCPDNLLLFMHHVPYTYVIHSGKTVIQHIYDSHYEGAEEADGFVGEWESLKGRIDEQRYNEVLDRLKYQAGHAEEWRDAVCNWFLSKSGIPDTKGRAGHFPDRIEGKSMKLDGYQVVDVTPFEASSGGKALSCPDGFARCLASFRYTGTAGWHELRIRYFDLNSGVAHFRLSVGGQVVSEWKADDTLPSAAINAHTSTRHDVAGLALRPGDEILVEGFPDNGDRAALDYVEILPKGAGGPGNSPGTPSLR
ncbi:MAG TPA: alpha-glucuronidase family glycosyl hydrolase [Blastocatellia bacterium]|nr:alpha-glucuronidase family glycosyl hydrolase [Blastocatellia bacterium]